MIPIGVLAQLSEQTPQAVQQRYALAEAKRAFNHVYTKSWMVKVWAFLTHRSARILDLRQVQAAKIVWNRHYAGVHTVPIDHIRGSENRTSDFDVNFNPVRLHNQSRWIQVAAALCQGIILPPVELIKVGETYFVRDGHHRISAARALGQKEIDAVVTVWDVHHKQCAQACC